MRLLHVLESFAPGGMETTFLNVLRHFRDADGSVEHHVLAFAGGALEQGYRDAADGVAIGCDPDTIERHLSAPYDLAYILFERCAYRAQRSDPILDLRERPSYPSVDMALLGAAANFGSQSRCSSCYAGFSASSGLVRL